MINENSDIFARFAKLESRVDQLEQIVKPNSAVSTSTNVVKQQSLREFLNEKSPATANDRGLSIAYYMETIKQFECFNAEDIKTGFREARIPVPKNPNDIINKNIAKGNIMDTEQRKDGKKAWVLTITGMQKVKNGFRKKA